MSPDDYILFVIMDPLLWMLTHEICGVFRNRNLCTKFVSHFKFGAKAKRYPMQQE